MLLVRPDPWIMRRYSIAIAIPAKKVVPKQTKHLILGDREKTRKTYREFVLFDSEDVYPEYVIEYQRKY